MDDKYNKILNNDDYKKIIKSKYKLNIEDIEIISAKWEPLSEDIEGFLGDHYILQLKFESNSQELTDTFFIKTKPNKTEIQKQMTTEFNSYEKEMFMYDNLQKKFQKLGYDVSFAPWSFYCKNQETLVMENLKDQGFKLYQRNKFFDMEHCQCALKSMATYHGNSISLEEKMSQELGKEYRLCDGQESVFEEHIYKLGDCSGLGFKFCDKSVRCFLKLNELIPENEEWKKIFEKKLTAFDAGKIVEKNLPYKKTCGHGDLWSNNMLFQYSPDNTPIHCKLVDFQLLRYFYPCFDALLILYENTRKDFRQKYLNLLLNYYYDNLSEVVFKNGFDLSKILSRSDFFESVKHIKVLAVFQAAAVRTMILLPTDTLNTAVEDGGDDLNDIIFDDGRANMVFKYAQKDEEFRNILIDDAYDLYENL